MDLFKRFKLIFSSSKYSLRRISSASEKSLKVIQEIRDISEKMESDLSYVTEWERQDRESIELPHELKILGKQVLSTVIENSFSHRSLVIIYNNTVKWYPIPKISSKSMLIREEISRDYLSKVLHLSQNKLGGLFLIVNLDDSYYQGPFEEFVWNYCGRTGFSRGVVWPNMEAQRNFIGKIDVPDSLQWKRKANNCCFYGSDTGSKDVESNDRVRFARLANQLNSPLFTAKITDWVQIDTSNLPFDRSVITGSYVTMQDQLKSKIVFSIDGNVSSWERPTWIMNSNSVLDQL